MEFEWDANKNAANIAKHGVDFELIESFDWTTALVAPDRIHSKEEAHFTALGYIHQRLFVRIYTWRKNKRRLISLRRANLREKKLYEQKT